MQAQSNSTAVPWTESQRAGIYDRCGSTVVSAAAGTGKTAVLAERCVDHVAGKAPIDIDRMLVVTFTEPAALQMRERIRKRLRDLCGDRPAGRLLRQLALLDAASISTLHAFCLQVVRENFTAAGVEPDVGVLDEDEARMLKDDVLADLFESLYSGQTGRSRHFTRFVAHYGQGHDAGIQAQVLRIHEYLRSLPLDQRDAWKQRAMAAYTLDADGTLTAEQFATLRETILGEIDLMLEMSHICLDAFRAQIGPHKGLISGEAVHTRIALLRETLSKAATPAAFKAWIDQAGDVEWTGVGRWGDVPPMCRDWAKWLYDHWKTSFEDRWIVSAEAWSHGIRITADHAELLLWLVEQFDEGYSRQKRRIGKIDYSDMEELAFRLLSGRDGRPSEIARAFQRRYEVVLVDEFQDTNPIQAAIMHLVSRESADPPQPNLFVVGDVKQSIYGFRMTDPGLFRQRQESIARGTIAGRCVSLQENFRSRPEILAFVNRIFRKLMRGAEAEVDYDATAELRPGGEDFPQADGPAVELHVLDRSSPSAAEEEETEQDNPSDQTDPQVLARREKEAYLIACRIKALLGRPVREGQQVRPLLYRDMVILLRSTHQAATEYAGTLRRCGIPVYAELRSGYFASREIRDMLCLLQVLENMRQDIPLAAVLRSPLFGEPLTDADLAEIRLARPALEFHQAVRCYAEAGPDADLRRRIARPMALMERWRTEGRLKPLSEMISDIYRQTGLLEYVTLLDEGLQARANLLSLYERARQFSQFSRQGLRRFVQFVMKMIQAGHEANAPTAVSQAQDVVRIMSIHASKGLEFPVVFVADLGSRFNDMDIHSSIVLDRMGGLGIEACDPDRMARSNTLVRLLAAEQARRRARAEELRVLYVALTRAKERLLLVGSPPRGAENALKENQQLWRDWSRPLPRHVVRRAGCMLDWLLPALAAKDQAGTPHLFDWRQVDGQEETAAAWTCSSPPADPAGPAVFFYPRHTTNGWKPGEGNTRLSGSQLLGALGSKGGRTSAASEQVIARLSRSYRYEKLTRIPAVLSVTELKGRLDWGDEEDADPVHGPSAAAARSLAGPLDVPRRLRSAGSGDAARQRGTATHLFLQKVNLSGPTDRKALADQLSALITQGLLSSMEADRIDLGSIDWFLNETHLGRLLRENHMVVRREMPFILRMEPQRLIAGSGSDDLEDAGVVRGVVDVLWATPEGIEIADFKTDTVEGPELRRRIDLYRDQLRMYAEAIRRIWNRPVCRLWLAFLHPRHIEPLTPAPLRG